MGKRMEFMERVEKIVSTDPRYKVDAYAFVMAALHYTQKMIGERRHVSGKELLEGIRRYALEEFGVMARTVFDHWGIRCTEDFGNIVFNMVDAGLMSKREEDSIDDFKDGYEFEEAFEKAFK
jgi:uncharacterized repeat protein (TIGR04138 family)